MASLTLRSVKGTPLTNNEIDANFTNLNDELATKLTASDYNAADVLTKIKTADGSGSGLDADFLDGLSAESSNVFDTIVARDSSGNFAAATITANLVGGVTGNITGNVTGNLTGDVTGDVTGDLLGNVVGNVFGDLTGNVTGNLLGKVGNITPDTGAFTTITASGSVTLSSTLIVGGSTTLNGPLNTNTSTGNSGQYLVSRGGALSPTWSSLVVDLTSQVNQILPATNGGTGLSAAGAAGNILTSNGVSWLSSPLNIVDGSLGAGKLNGEQEGVAPAFAIRAWANVDGNVFDGAGVCTIRGAGNITSVVRTAAGKYTVTLTAAMPNTNFAVVANASATNSSSSTNGVEVSHYSTTSQTVFLIEVTDPGSNTYVDAKVINLMVIG